MAGAAILLPFLPMLPTQILLNNFLYDFAQVTIPTDNIDPGFVRRPQAVLPYTPLAAPLGLAALPASYFAFLALMVESYLVVVEVVKERLMRRLLLRVA